MNAKRELITLSPSRTIKCAAITYGGSWDEEDNTHIYLKVEHTPEEYQSFLNQLDFDYDNGYGGQMLFGTIWYTDGTWATRGEYDGSEWWDHHELPAIPNELLS